MIISQMLSTQYPHLKEFYGLNRKRHEDNLSTLFWNNNLYQAAQYWLAEMGDKYWSTNNVDGLKPIDVLNAEKFSMNYGYIIISRTDISKPYAFQEWISKEDFGEILLLNDLRNIGIAHSQMSQTLNSWVIFIGNAVQD